jgi:hypothetical protein
VDATIYIDSEALSYLVKCKGESSGSRYMVDKKVYKRVGRSRREGVKNKEGEECTSRGDK